MTGFALNAYLAQVLCPAPEQKPELALAFTVLNLGFAIPSCLVARLRARGRTATIANNYDRDESYTPRELQGPVFSIRRLIAWAVMPVSTVSAGGVLDPGYVFASLGLIWVVFCTAQLFLSAPPARRRQGLA